MNGNRMKCVEAVYDALVGAGLDVEHESFDDAVMACVDCALPGARFEEPSSWIADMDDTRDEVEVILDLIEWSRASGSREPISDVLARAVEAGRRGWYGENGVPVTA